MADIYAFPTQINDQSIRRLIEKLSAAFEAGEDLGSRVPHIHAIAETLERTLINLDCEINVLKTHLSNSEAELFLQEVGIEKMLMQFEKLIASARSFPAASQ